jgi:ribosomal protein L29
MVAKKTTTKSTENTKKSTKFDVKGKTVSELNQELLSSRNSLVEAKLSNRQGELINPRIITTTRKKIARILTAIKATDINGRKEDK